MIVSHAEAGGLATPELEAVTYSTGLTLESVALPEGWSWADPAAAVVVENEGYTAYYAVTDSDTTDWSGVEGYDPENMRVVRTIDLEVLPAAASVAENPSAGYIRSGSQLSASTISGGSVLGLEGQTLEGTWTWKNDRVMSERGTFTETIVFTPNDTNYAAAETEIEIDVYAAGGGGGTSTGWSGGTSSGGSPAASATAEPTTSPEATAEPGSEPGSTAAPQGDSANPFTDVSEDDWYYGAVEYVYENGIFGGVSETEFAPNQAITRGMLVTVLWRAEGEPVVNHLMTFEDVDVEEYYGEAVRWAASEGIVKGYSEIEFAPDQLITREEFAAVMERYADYKGIATDEQGDLTQFIDETEVSDWARANVEWAVGSGLITGTDEGRIDPQGNTTRAEAATILQRFLDR